MDEDDGVPDIPDIPDIPGLPDIPDIPGIPDIPNSKSYFQTVKTSLKSVVKDDDVIRKLTDAALLVNRIMIHTLQFIKLYYIHLYDNRHDNPEPLPSISKKFVNAVMKIMCVQPRQGGRPAEDTVRRKATLAEFFVEHYEPTMRLEEGLLNYSNLTTALEYMSKEVVTMFENNIQQRFASYVERFVNISLQKKQRIEEINSGEGTAEEKKEMVIKSSSAVNWAM
jgi:hypothetical protein